MRATSVRTIIESLAVVLLATVPAAFGQRAIPTGGLLLHLDGIDPLNTATTWHDSSVFDINGTVNNAGFTSGVGYTFGGETNWVSLAGQGVVVNTGDNFAYSVRLVLTALPDSNHPSGILGESDGTEANNLMLDYTSLGAPVNFTAAYFNGASYVYSTITTPSTGLLGTGEHQIGLTWVADSPGATTGTAQLYEDGAEVAQLTGFNKIGSGPYYKYNVTTIGSVLGNGTSGTWGFNGNINEVAVYSNFSGTPDALMSSIFNATAVPEPSTVALIVFGALGAGAMVRRHRSRHD